MRICFPEWIKSSREQHFKQSWLNQSTSKTDSFIKWVPVLAVFFFLSLNLACFAAMYMLFVQCSPSSCLFCGCGIWEIHTHLQLANKSSNGIKYQIPCKTYIVVTVYLMLRNDAQLKCVRMLLSSLSLHFWRSEFTMQVGHVTDGRLRLVSDNPATTRVTSQPHDSITSYVSNQWLWCNTSEM